MYEVNVTELRIAMAEAGINTIDELSRASGVNRNTISDVLNKKSFPSSSVMSRIASALKLEGSRAGTIFFAPKLT